MSIESLAPQALRLHVDPESLGFTDTGELPPRPLAWIGQARAERAARFGLQMPQADYHLFVVGEAGSGRSTLLERMAREVAATRAVPPDLCYLDNFDEPERPRALRLPAGEGRLLRELMADLARRMQAEIPKRLAAPEVQSACERDEAGVKAEQDRAFDALQAFAEARRFRLLREQGRLVFTRHEGEGAGEPLTAARALAMTREERAALDADEDALLTEITRFQDAARLQETALAERLTALRRRFVKPLVDHALQEIRNRLRKQIKDSVKLGAYFEQVEQHLLDHLEVFQPGDEEDEPDRVDALVQVLSRLRVNVVVDNHDAAGAPVIVDDNPLFRALFGSIEYESRDEVLVADFTRIRAGSLLRAHGGFLLLHLRDLLADHQVWEKLRRFLRSGRLQIEEPGMVHAPIAAVSLRPEPVDVDVKLVLVASPDEYRLVQDGDPDVARRFRCKVEFDDSFEATPATRAATADFVADACRRLALPHFRAGAVAALIEAMHRDADDQRRQSACFARTEALVMEAAAAAQSRGAARVEAADVDEALRTQRARHDLAEQRLHEGIRDGERLLQVHGERVGQLNALVVADLGDHRFGFPVRVSATTHAGDEGLLDIEREVELSGPIHDKGVLILHSHLSALFAHLAPLALEATLVFDQEYAGVEGDSASCAEFCALMSGLSGLPLRQGIAVTGALNPRGELLPVGGVNEKVEGFFRACEALGLDGAQGVLIPRRNRRHLMLSAGVVDAVAAGRFHLYAADEAGEAMALLTGRPWGTLGPGGYAADTVLGQAQRTLQAYRRACGAAAKAHESRPGRPLRPSRKPR